MYKRRKVRYCYPTPFVQLALHLLEKHTVKDVARHIGPTPATLYRWGCNHPKTRKTSDSPTSDDAFDAVTFDLACACEQYGFNVRDGLIKLNVFAFERKQIVATHCASDFASTERNHDANMEFPRKQRAKTKHYFFDVEKARNSRNVFERLRLAKEVIERRYNSHLSCEELARAAGMSRDHFVRVYKHAFGQSAQQHLARVRVNHACTLLQSTLQPVGLIATAVGFDSYATLSRAFKSVTGISVAEFCRGSQHPKQKVDALFHSANFSNIEKSELESLLA
jgi:AraC-like DNA-binding protein